MIVSHDSYTYQKPKNILMRAVDIFWKTQKLNIDEQYALGVRVFDVRVYRYKNKKWGTAHGLAKFDKSFDTICDICKFFKTNYKDSIIRIYLEDNVDGKNEKIKNIYLDEIEEAYDKYKDMIWEIGTHHPWNTIYRNVNRPWKELKDYCCHLFNWNTDKSISYNLKHFDCSSWSLPSYAKKHNIPITQEMIDDKNIAYMFDYIGIYPSY